MSPLHQAQILILPLEMPWEHTLYCPERRYLLIHTFLTSHFIGLSLLYTLLTQLTSKINQVFGVSSPRQLADHVMYCLPPDSFSGIAYAYLNSWNSVYKNEWCNHLSGLMHEVRTYFVLSERRYLLIYNTLSHLSFHWSVSFIHTYLQIGHNLDYSHAGEGSNSYGDRSGYMGISYSQNVSMRRFLSSFFVIIRRYKDSQLHFFSMQNGPLMCFNGEKYWHFPHFYESFVHMICSSNIIFLISILLAAKSWQTG